MKIILTTLILFAASLFLAGCASTGFESETPAAADPSAAGTTGGTDTFPTGGGTSVYPYDRSGNVSGRPGGAGGTAAGGRGQATASSDRVVYFDFDSAEIRAEYRPIVEANARYLVSNPGSAVVLEGHTDSQGTREYNVGLGERRADAVRRMMGAFGVPPNQVRTLSYGEERPAVDGNDESSYAQNRRVEITF